MLRQLLDSVEPHFTHGGKLERLFPLYELVDTFLPQGVVADVVDDHRTWPRLAGSAAGEHRCFRAYPDDAQNAVHRLAPASLVLRNHAFIAFTMVQSACPVRFARDLRIMRAASDGMCSIRIGMQ